MISTTARLATLATLLLPLVSATFTFNTAVHDSSTNSTDDYALSPSWGISAPCANAYAADIPCDRGLIDYNETNLAHREGICTDQCIDGLRKWRDNIQAKCSTADVKAATSQLSDIGLTIIDSKGPPGAQVLASVANPKLPVVEALYFVYCMKDLKTGEICASYEQLTEGTDMKDNATYCANTCLTQYVAFVSGIETALYGTNETANVDIQTMCPGIDTSNYPATLSLKSASSYSFASSDSSSSSSGSPSGSPTNTSGADTPKQTGAASSLKGSLWGMGSIVVAVAIGVFVL